MTVCNELELVPGPALADVLRPAHLGPRQVAVLQ